jgi:hypothetical protein
MTWTEADVACLRELPEQGASIVCTAAALHRKTTSVAKMASIHKLALAGTRKLKASFARSTHYHIHQEIDVHPFL